MGRREHQHLVLKCNKGVNQQAGIADLDECADALNVWAPNGVVERRPGYRGVTSLDVAGMSTNVEAQWYLSYTASAGSPAYVTAAEGGTLSLNSFKAQGDTNATGDQWFLGFSAFKDIGVGDIHGRLIGISIGVTNQNANSVHFKSEYWDGTDWRWIQVTEHGAPHLSGETTKLSFAAPEDWATTTLNSITAYFIRFTLLDSSGDSTSALGSSVTLNNTAGTFQRGSRVGDVPFTNDGSVASEGDPNRGLFVAQFPTKKRYFQIWASLPHSGASLSYYVQSDSITFESGDLSSGVKGPDRNPMKEETLASMAVVPQFEEAFIAYGGVVSRQEAFGDYPSASGGGEWRATAEDRDFAVGEDAPYDKDFVGQEGNFPPARFIVFFKNRLWCAGLTGEPFTVRWSAAAPYHKVWPTLSAEPLMEDDNSPITGMAGYGEQVAVFKSDSVWLMVNTGSNPATQVEHYSPIRIVAGVGCVSNSSIQQIRGNLVFLAEDGVYVFDGTPAIRKISDRVTDTIDSITGGRRHLAVSAHWKTKSCYLLSFATDGEASNSKTLVWDYKNDAWWIWDIPAVIWLVDEDPNDDELVYFVDKYQQIHLLDDGNHDHGAAISSHILTQRIGADTNVRRTVRQVEVASNNKPSSFTVSVRANDDSSNEASGTLSMTDSTEATYGVATDGVDKYVLDRRRGRRVGFRKQGDFLQVKVEHSAKNETYLISSLDVALSGAVRR